MQANNKLAKSVRLALMFGAATAMTGVAVAQDADEEESAERVERIQVTGSRLNRTDMEGALPVTVINREDLLASGDMSVADYLRDTNFNSFGSYPSTSNNSWGGAALIDLRGLGAGRTLVLVDGRRAPTSPMTGEGQDLNSIPMGAVERIEILTDGASAVYGSDAIGGVVNVITRKDYQGVEFTMGVGKPTEKGGESEEMSFIVGSASDKGRVLFGASFNSRDRVYDRDRDYLYPSVNSSGSYYSNNIDGLEHPVYGEAVPGVCTDEANGFWMDYDWGECNYDHMSVSMQLTDVKNTSLFGRSDYYVNDNWTLYFNGGFNRVESFSRAASTPSFAWPSDIGAIELKPGSPNHPGTAPENGGLNPQYDDYYAQFADVTLPLYHRFAALGPRDNQIRNETFSVSSGVEGVVGEVDVSFGVRYVKGSAMNLGSNYVVGGLSQPFIDSGEYNIYDPFAGDPQSLGMTGSTSRDMESTVKEVYANVVFDLFEMSSGVASAAFGVEYRDENYVSTFDALSEKDLFVGVPGNSAEGKRSVRAAYAEMLFPLFDTLDLELAGRYDSYSDYGSDFSPKVAASWRPFDNFLLRASYGEGFRAPTLTDIGSKPMLSAQSVSDAISCEYYTGSPGCSYQILTYVLGNENLESEQSKQYSLGLVWSATDWLSVGVDYYNIELTGSITNISIGTVVNCLREQRGNCPAGIAVFDSDVSLPDQGRGLGATFVDNDPQKAVLSGQTGMVNLGEMKTSGFDFDVRTNFEVAGGHLSNQLSVTYVKDYTVDGGESFVGYYGAPKYNASFNNMYSVGDFSFSWNVSYTDSMKETHWDWSDAEDDWVLVGTPSWVIHNVQGNYHTPWNGTFTLGVSNLFNRAPADAYVAGGGEYNYQLYNPFGRVPYARYTQRF